MIDGNCHLNRPIGDQITNSGLFSTTEIVKFNFGMFNRHGFFDDHIYGWATKEKTTKE